MCSHCGVTPPNNMPEHMLTMFRTMLAGKMPLVQMFMAGIMDALEESGYAIVPAVADDGDEFGLMIAATMLASLPEESWANLSNRTDPNAMGMIHTYGEGSRQKIINMALRGSGMTLVDDSGNIVNYYPKREGK